MPYLQASAADLQRVHHIGDDDLPEAAVLVGVSSFRRYGQYLTAIWPAAREVAERLWLIETNGRRVWHVATFGGAMAATYAHLAVNLGARAIFQFGLVGSLQNGWEVGDGHTLFNLTDADRLRIRTAREAMERCVPEVLVSLFSASRAEGRSEEPSG
jgi:hypothetical protein